MSVAVLTRSTEPTVGAESNSLNADVCDRARVARDPRFDGRFFTGVLTTRIYCRPVCPVRPARSDHVRFFPSAAAAEQAGFRPCLRCRPELAPGTPRHLDPSGTVSRAVDLIECGFLDERRVEDLGAAVGIGARHLSRLFDRYLGAPPAVIARTRRVQVAKLLLSETRLSITAVAFAAGFGSVRRFNAVFASTYGASPSRIRHVPRVQLSRAHEITIRMAFRTPFDWSLLLTLFRAEAIPGVEEVTEDTYRRTLRIRGQTGWLEARLASRGDYLAVSLALPDPSGLRDVLSRVRRMFDVDADPWKIKRQLEHQPVAGALVRNRPGVRLPGTWDGFELALRALVARQVEPSRVRTVLEHLVRKYGKLAPASRYVFPTPAVLSRVPTSSFISARLACGIRRLAYSVGRKGVRFDPTVTYGDIVSGLCRWAKFEQADAHWIAMRVTGEPDADSTSVVQVLTNEKIAETWRPWRSYVAVLIACTRLTRGVQAHSVAEVRRLRWPDSGGQCNSRNA